jgi:hypothetical protein
MEVNTNDLVQIIGSQAVELAYLRTQLAALKLKYEPAQTVIPPGANA